MEMTKRAVQSGQMTREQAMERFNAWRQRNGIDRGPTDRPQTDRAPQRGPQPQGRPPQSRPQRAPQTQSRSAIPATKATPVRPAERKPQSAQEAKLKSEAIPATKIQPSRIFQLPPEKKEQE